MPALAHWHIEGQNGPLSNECADRGIISFQSLIEWVEQLPYLRNSRPDYSLVLEEECGTCSTKNGLIKAVALENNWLNVKLYVGIFNMSNTTHPAILNLLQEVGLPYIPEAHTYLRIEGAIRDVSGLPEGKEAFDLSLRKEKEIEPDEISGFKQEWHKKQIAEESHELGMSPQELWEIRERCIAQLATNRY